MPAKFFSSNSSSSIKEVEVPDENVRQSPIGAETSDEELHATLVGDDDWEPWEEDEEICASPNRLNSIQFDKKFKFKFQVYFFKLKLFSKKTSWTVLSRLEGTHTCPPLPA